MKKLLKTVLSLGAALLGVVAFCMIFVAPLSFVYERILTGETVTMELAWNYVFIGGPLEIPIVIGGVEILTLNFGELAFNSVPVVGFILIAVGVLVTLFLAIKPKKRGLIYTISTLLSVAAFVVGGILIYYTKDQFLAINSLSELPDFFLDTLQTNPSIYLGMALAFVAAFINLINLFVPSKK